MDVKTKEEREDKVQTIVDRKADLKGNSDCCGAVSYTHLDVYKRQVYTFLQSVKSFYGIGSNSISLITM